MAEERVNRKLAAILAADVVGYSRLMGADEAGTLAALKQHRQNIFDPAVAAHNGRTRRRRRLCRCYGTDIERGRGDQRRDTPIADVVVVTSLRKGG